MRYFDTSALVKQYLQEAGSKTVLELLKTGERVFTASLTYAETHAAFSRRSREGRLTRETTRRLALRFDKDWESYDIVTLSENVSALRAGYFIAILSGLPTHFILRRRCFLLERARPLVGHLSAPTVDRAMRPRPRVSTRFLRPLIR